MTTKQDIEFAAFLFVLLIAIVGVCTYLTVKLIRFLITIDYQMLWEAFFETWIDPLGYLVANLRCYAANLFIGEDTVATIDVFEELL